MSRTNRKRPGARPGGPRRRITVRSTKRTPPDLRKLSRALLDLAAAQAEAAGAAFLIAKPFTPESFDEALGAVLGAHP